MSKLRTIYAVIFKGKDKLVPDPMSPDDVWEFPNTTEAFLTCQALIADSLEVINPDEFKMHLWAHTPPWVIETDNDTVRHPDGVIKIAKAGDLRLFPYSDRLSPDEKWKITLRGSEVELFWDADKEQLFVIDHAGMISKEPMLVLAHQYLDIQIDGKHLTRIQLLRYIAVLIHVHIRMGGDLPPSLYDYLAIEIAGV